MQTAFDNLPEAAKESYRKITGDERPPVYSLFCENWETTPELPSIDTYLSDYAFFAAHEERAVKLPVGWYKKAAGGDEEKVRQSIQSFPYDQIEACYVEKFLQSSNIVIKIKDREIRIEKCQLPHADRFVQLWRSRKEKKAEVDQEKWELIYPVAVGHPSGFHVAEDGSVSVMFVKPNISNRGPSEFTILVYKERQIVRSYHFEPRQ